MHDPFCSREGEREGQSSNNGDDDDNDDHEHGKMKPIKLLFAIGFGDFGHGSNIRAPTGTVVDLKISQQSFKDISRLDVGPPKFHSFLGARLFLLTQPMVITLRGVCREQITNDGSSDSRSKRYRIGDLLTRLVRLELLCYFLLITFRNLLLCAVTSNSVIHIISIITRTI